MPSARAWREYPRRYRYEAAVCDKCGKWFFPARLICNECGGREFTTQTMRRTGKVRSYTVIRTPPAPFKDQAPYIVGIVEMDDGPSINTQITDCSIEQLAVGMPVRLEFRKIYEEGESGIINYGYKAVPA